jgi:hypothetical protein
LPEGAFGQAAQVLLPRVQEQGHQSSPPELRGTTSSRPESQARTDGNYAALTWHHRDRSAKSFEMDMRSLSNRSAQEIRTEARKCTLLCANCHAEEHFPQFLNRTAVSPRKQKAPH